jgi:uncharacterized glyoxalase superfamily protein PhnB
MEALDDKEDTAMTVNPIPEGYHTVTPYIVAADVDRLLDFVEAAFDAAEKERVPSQDGRTGHAEVTIGDSYVMLGREQEGFPALPAMLYLYVPNTDATYARALAAGATSVQEPADMFYGDRSAGVKDPAGNTWMIATRQENLTPEELAERAKEHMR